MKKDKKFISDVLKVFYALVFVNTFVMTMAIGLKDFKKADHDKFKHLKHQQEQIENHLVGR